MHDEMSCSPSTTRPRFAGHATTIDLDSVSSPDVPRAR